MERKLGHQRDTSHFRDSQVRQSSAFIPGGQVNKMAAASGAVQAAVSRPLPTQVQVPRLRPLPNDKPSALVADTEQKQDWSWGLEMLRQKLEAAQRLLDELDRMQNVDSPMPVDPNAPVAASAEGPREIGQEPRGSVPTPMSIQEAFRILIESLSTFLRI